MVLFLSLSLEETIEFFDLAAIARKELPADVTQFLTENKSVVSSVRKLMYAPDEII